VAEDERWRIKRVVGGRCAGQPRFVCLLIQSCLHLLQLLSDKRREILVAATHCLLQLRSKFTSYNIARLVDVTFANDRRSPIRGIGWKCSPFLPRLAGAKPCDMLLSHVTTWLRSTAS